MKFTLFIPILAFVFSCGNSKEAAKEVVKTDASTISIDSESQVPKEPNDGKPQRNVMIKATIGSFKETDPFTINDANIVGNTLFLTVSYSGGCTEHRFEFLGNPAVMKSMPPIRSVQLVHNSNNDLCESYVTRIIEIDLKNIAYIQNSGSELMFMLEGWNDKLKYVYE